MYILFLMLVLLVAGCSGGKYYQSWPMESEINGTKYHYHNAVQLNLPTSMFHATNSENWVEYCRVKIADPVTENEFLYPFQDCVREEQYHLSTMGSVASQFVTPVLTTSMYAGSLAYGMHQIGRGLAKSGPTVTQTGNGNASAGSLAGSSSQSHSSSSAKGGNGGALNLTDKSHTSINGPVIIKGH